MSPFISSNVGGNIHEAVSFVNSCPALLQRCVFQFVPLGGSASIVIFYAGDREDQRAIREYLGQKEQP